MSEKISRVELFARGNLQVREERAGRETSERPCRLLYISDLHLGAANSRKILEEVIQATKSISPNLILLGGDFLDRRSALALLERLFSELSELAPTLAVPGNHDEFCGTERIADSARKCGVSWLPDASVYYPEWNVEVDARPRIAQDRERRRVLCVHDPAIFSEADGMGYRVAFAGHLHGSQFVFLERNQSLYPGRFFFRWNILREELGETSFFVSRGVNDTLPIRFNCPRELLVCNLY